LTSISQLSPDALAAARTEAIKLEASAYQLSKNVYGLTSPME
jgi:hypothetical protein